MGTRGFIGFVADGDVKVAYNHCDSYPDGLGLKTLNFLRRVESSDLRQWARDLRVVDPASDATPEDIERLREYADTHVGSKQLTDWYVLLRRTQGDPELMLKAGVIEDSSDFPANSLFCEWGYLVDIDEGRFEVYRGFQTEQHNKGRFASMPHEDMHVGTYHPVALAASWPLDELPDDKTFLAIDKDEDDE